MEITGILVMPHDTTVVPVDRLSPELRQQINADEGDFAVTRPNSRTTTRIVDAEAARLLEEFRNPSTVVQAVIRYCAANQKDPEQTLDAAFPMLRQLVYERLLVPSDSPSAKKIHPVLEDGSIFAGAEVLSCVQNVEDTDVYRVRMPDGEVAALKLMRPGEDVAVAARFEREAAVLRHLDGTVTPSLLSSDIEGDPRYLLLSWCEGSDCGTCARHLRNAGDRRALLRLCVAILDAYARLHQQGVVHSDVHAGNILVDGDYKVHLIDFGLARIDRAEEPVAAHQRGGVGYFLDPEYVHSQRLHRRPPPSSTLGEQYSIAAVLYFLFTGKHYLDFSLERREMERQIVEDGPLPFSAHSVLPWPAVEDALRRALSKEPAERFRSIDEFTTALSAAEDTADTSPPAGIGQLRRTFLSEILQRVLTRLDLGSGLLESGLSAAPKASLTYGSAGVACALHRIACVRQDPKLLALADLWSERAVRESHEQDAWNAAEIVIMPEGAGLVSPYDTESGVHFIRALIAGSRGDAAAQREAVEAFIANSVGPCDSLDLIVGRSGTLLAASHIMAATVPGSLDLTALRELGNEALHSIWQRLDAFAPMGECPGIALSGMAHGWAGILYATLSWSRASATEAPSHVRERLDQLAGLAHRAVGQASWNPRVGHLHNASDPLIGSWCNGTAGQVQLWLAAHAMWKDERYFSLAEQAGRHTAAAENGMANLCCGFAGQAYALLALYRHTGEPGWLRRAEELAEKAAASQHARSEASTEAIVPFRDSLHKGETGLAVLAVDLESPATSGFPAFELTP